jgi:hypothetical protein
MQFQISDFGFRIYNVTHLTHLTFMTVVLVKKGATN